MIYDPHLQPASAASIFGRIVPAHFADRYGYLKVMTIMAYLTAICVFVIWLPISFHHSVAGIIIFSIFFGFTSGAFVSLLTPCMVELCGGKIGDLGVMLGTFMGINSFA